MTEQDGVMTPMRIIDAIKVVSNDGKPAENVTINLTLFIMIKAGEAVGKRHFIIKHAPPGGLTTTMLDTSHEFKRGPDSFNINMKLAGMVVGFGLHWFEVYDGDRLLSRVPFQVLRQDPDKPPQPGN